MSHGASCANWTWSWSFVNQEERFVVFGAWDDQVVAGRVLIFSEDWRIGSSGRRNPSWPQSREHLRLVEEEGFRLMIFSQSKAPRDPANRDAPCKIARFTPELHEARLQCVDGSWHAVRR